MKEKIYVFMGLSGSGKSTLANKIGSFLRMPVLIQTTTRPIRPNEFDGIDYDFTDNEKFDSLAANDCLTAIQTFNVAGGHIWKYGLNKEQIKHDSIVVLPPIAVEQLKEAGYDVVTIFIDLDEDIRLDRIGARKDNQASDEIKRRSKADKKAFENFTPDYIVDNSKSIHVAFYEILEKVFNYQFF